MAKIIAKHKVNKLDKIELLKNGIVNITQKNNRYEIKISFIKSDLEKEVYIKFIIPDDYKKCFPFLGLRKFTPGSIFSDKIIQGLRSRKFIIYIAEQPIMKKFQFYQFTSECRQFPATFSLLGFKVLNELNNFIVKEQYRRFEEKYCK